MPVQCLAFVTLLASLILALPCAALAAARPATGDPLVEALAAAGLSPDRLKFEPEGTWLRYPDPKQIPYVNRMFSDLFAHPDRIDDTLRLMAQASRDFLGPAYRGAKVDGLFRAAYFTGWDLRLSGHREYTAALDDKAPSLADAEDPLVFAVERLYRDLGIPFDLVRLDKPADFPRRREDTRSAAAKLDPELRAIVAQAVLDLADALRWHRVAFAEVDGHDMLSAAKLRDLGATQFDGMEYHAECDRIARDLDERSLNTSSRKTVAAGERLVKSIEAWRPKTKADLAAQRFDLVTPAGRIVVSGSGNDTHEEPDLLLLVDLGGDDLYRGGIGGSTLAQPVTLVVDVAGNDRYVADDERTNAQGSGILGTGVLIDAAGDDTYRAYGSSQGYGLFGTGLLADLRGNDRYELIVEGQGAAEFGVGLLFDLAGDDAYRIVSAGQGFGGVGNGIGTLVDLEGNDCVLRRARLGEGVPAGRPLAARGQLLLRAGGGGRTPRRPRGRPLVGRRGRHADRPRRERRLPLRQLVDRVRLLVRDRLAVRRGGRRHVRSLGFLPRRGRALLHRGADGRARRRPVRGVRRLPHRDGVRARLHRRDSP